MNVLTFASRKGGAGKSTLAAHLAVHMHAARQSCLLVDDDPQGSLTLWNELRAEYALPLKPVKRGIGEIVKKARKHCVDWVLIDTPSNGSASVIDAIEAATLVVIPCRPGLFDIDAVQQTIAFAQQARTPYAVILNAAPPKRHGARDSLGLVYLDKDEAAVLALVTRLLAESNPFKNRVVLINRDLRTVRSRMSERTWSDIIPHEQARAELDFMAASIRERDMLKSEGLNIRRGLLLSGPPGDGKSTAIECFVNDIAGEASVIIIEAVEHIRAVYHLAQTIAPAVVILEDLDMMTKSRDNPYAFAVKDDVTGELLQVLSGGSAYSDIITIATTNHPEAIDQALAKRAGRFEAHIRMGYPSDAEKKSILQLYLDRFSVNDDLTRHRLQQVLTRDFDRLHLVPAHIEEFVKAGVKRARLAHRTPEYLDFEPGIEATKSVAVAKTAVH